MYEIRQINDMLKGASLVVTALESDLDKKALYTIEEAKPSFILPFRTRCIDGKIEFNYQVSTLCKLQYMTGDSTINEYVELWRSVLSPLLSCDDWFMRTQSFVLDVDYLFYDKEKKSVSFVYIPTLRNSSEHEDLKKMAGELAKQIPVQDMTLENKVLKMIMNDFSPRAFLKMLAEYNPQPISAPLRELQTITHATKTTSVEQAEHSFAPMTENSTIEEIHISTPLNSSELKKPKEKRKLFGKKEKGKQKATKNTTKPDFKCDEPETLEIEPVEDVTQFISIIESECVLRLVGSPLLPNLIRIEIEEGEVFTIGRYDATVGKKQSSFEFERKTKAVSRRHAAIERLNERYSLIDLSSKAGTFINGQKLPPNTPVELENGAKISLGTSGADYIFEYGGENSGMF